MSFTSKSFLAIAYILMSSSVFAQPPKHAEAEKAMARIGLQKDFGDKLTFQSREVVTMAENDKLPGLNGLMFMRWKGEGPGTAVLASVQWFEKKDDLLSFYAATTKRKDYMLSKLDGTTVWKIGENGYSWTDGEHFLVSLAGAPPPPRDMFQAWLALIPSKVSEVENNPAVQADPLDERHKLALELVELIAANKPNARPSAEDFKQDIADQIDRTILELKLSAKDSELFREAALWGTAGVDIDRMTKIMANVYASKLSAKELKETIVFFKTDAGKAWLRKSAAIEAERIAQRKILTAEVMEATRRRLTELRSRIPSDQAP